MAEADSTPGYAVTIARPYYIGKYEVTQAQWKSFCELLGMPDLGRHPQHVMGPERLAHADELEARFVPRFLDRTAEEWFAVGLELRLPLLFSEGVRTGRITLQQFVALTSANHAKLYGLYPKKGTIAVGSDADFAIWDADKDVTIRWKDLHDNVGYSPYEGRQIKGWPITVVSRGRVVVEAVMAPRRRTARAGRRLPCPPWPAPSSGRHRTPPGTWRRTP